jgi:hypothetical protein
MSKKAGGQNKMQKIMNDFKNGVLKDKNGQIITDKNMALAKALQSSGLTNKDLRKAEVLNKLKVFKSQIEAEIKKELNNDNNISRDITRYFKSSSNPKIEEIQKEINDKYKIEKADVIQHVMRVSKDLIEKSRDSKKKIMKSTEAEEATVISDDVLTEAVNYIFNHVNVINKYDVPYLAGYSQDGNSIYIDRDCARYIEKDGKKFDMFPALVVHEYTEKSLMSKIDMPYELAHQIALRIERQAVGEEWWDDYNDVMEKYIAQALTDEMTELPPDLDLVPYKEMGDYAKLEEMYKVKQADIPLVVKEKEFSII